MSFLRTFKLKIETDDILFSLFLYSLLILRFGYEFGTGDQVELLPYVLLLKNPELYPYDFYLQGMQAIGLNERILFVKFLSLFSGHLYKATLVLHVISSFSLFLGMVKIARHFLLNKWLAFAVCLINFIPFYDFTLGGVELYYNTFQASNLAKGIGIWAIYCFIRGKYFFAVLIAALITYIQIITGLTMMMAFGLALIALFVIEKRVKFKQLTALFLVYTVIALPFLLLIVSARQGGAMEYNKDLFFSILYEFRHPHHFILSSFSIKKTLFFLVITFLAISISFKRSKEMFYFLSFTTAGIVVYAFCVDVFELDFIANFQWYKLTIWTKFIALLFIASLIEVIISKYLNVSKLKNVYRFGFVLIPILVFIAIFFFKERIPRDVPFHYTLPYSDEISFLKRSKEHLPVDAVFIQPFSTTALKFYAQRSSYVEFKANVRTPEKALEWYRRVQKVYGLDIGDQGKGFNLKETADKFYYNYSLEQITDLKREGVSNIFIDKTSTNYRSDNFKDLEVVYEEKDYSILKL